MKGSLDEFRQALRNAQDALKQGDLLSARRWAGRAAEIAPDREEPWLLLARLGTPRASVDYLNRALQINPLSERARQGMHWAVQRLRDDTQVKHQPPSIEFLPQSPAIPLVSKRKVFPWIMMPIILVLGISVWFAYPPVVGVFGRSAHFIPNDTELILPTYTPTPTFTPTYTPTLTPTASATPTFTPTNTPTFTPTNTSTPTYTPTLIPTSTLTNTPTIQPSETATPAYTTTPTLTFTPTYTATPTFTPSPTPPIIPKTVGKDGRWIDVDLTHQWLYAYEGNSIVMDFAISSGTTGSETHTGTFRVYSKTKSSNMLGEGYDVPAVPWVLFYDNDFALHGAYWIENFGVPKSHGCINMPIEESKWIFDWASVGSVINIHY